jgi:hypothetical protein
MVVTGQASSLSNNKAMKKYVSAKQAFIVTTVSVVFPIRYVKTNPVSATTVRNVG